MAIFTKLWFFGTFLELQGDCQGDWPASACVNEHLIVTAGHLFFCLKEENILCLIVSNCYYEISLGHY